MLHSKARLGVAEDQTKSALRRDPRMTTLRALAGISLMPTGQLTGFEDKLDKFKSCAPLVERELETNPVCPHCGFALPTIRATCCRPIMCSSPWATNSTAWSKAGKRRCAAVQEALSGLEKIVVTGEDKKALLASGSPATPEELRRRFESFLSERCKGKDTSKLLLVAEETGFWLIMTRLTSLFFWMFPCVNGHCKTPKRV